MIKLLYFAGIRDLTGVPEEQAPLAGRTVGELMEWAEDKYPGIREGGARVAVNEEYALDGDVLTEGDTAAFIPPVSGG
ncbi:molybdopterin synthase sulfur carrier subunit [Bhargavaea beijingensis]|uniref:Molybdopterin synthase sulfur carrier subunit n=1 Tax=Bhargavaea beijingensis TaxID=426756 RepID=A0A1G6XEE0_9BACL|nr:molybdopterin converting factor subunit 1 [Bhargavaea beijingensis]SDD76143.1 molybdopterin synthase sulfur carrier subunit [Bhargavaea beijingensis]